MSASVITLHLAKGKALQAIEIKLPLLDIVTPENQSHNGQQISLCQPMVYPLQDRIHQPPQRVFGTEPNKSFLLDFLNTLLPAHHHIQSLTFKNTENLGELPEDLKEQLDRLSSEQLETLSEIFPDWSTREELSS